MRFTLLLAALAGVAAMTGCAPAVAIHPLYTSRNLVSDLPLEGTWASSDGEVWQVKKSEDGYEVDSAQGSKYTVHLLRLNEYEFVDVASKSDPEVGVPGHLFGKIRMQGGQLYVSSIDETWLKQTMDAGIAPESTMGEGQQIVLTASTSELQKFILLHAADPDAWDDDDDGLHRVR
ncbi:MAG: hypothetical protein ABSF64_26790 [Bryobacteraceae bacterium]|jgi:hypothetical protein